MFSQRRRGAERVRIKGLAWYLALAGGFIFSSLGLVVAEGLPPKPAQFVEDGANILSAGTRAALNAKLAAYERETSNQVVVATYPEVPEGYAMEDFTQRTAEAWGVGQKASDNGVVFFIFPKSRKMRIEVGYGLEGAIPDATAKGIVDDVVRPAFRAGNFDGGVTAGVDAILAAAKGEYTGTGRTQAEVGGSDGPEAWMFLGFIVVVVVFGTLVRASQAYTYDSRGRRRHTSGWATWLALGTGPPGSGGGFSSSSGSSGGFSGGGGSFGGGGASGSW